MATASKSADKPAKPKTAAAKKAPKTDAAPAVPAAKAAPKKPAAPKKAAAPKKSAPATRPPLAPDQRRFYIEVAAYYIAERRGFTGGSQLDDWTQAEAEIDRLLQEGILNP